MAPISTDVLGLAFTAQPEATVLSVVVLFIAGVVLLALCASCKKHSFELDKTSAPEQKSSTLVSVARMDESGARQNPSANEITGDEIEGDIAVSEDGFAYKPWRSHTLTHDSSLNGGVEGLGTHQTM